MTETAPDRDSCFIGEALGRFVAESQWKALPNSLKHEAKRAILNYLGCVLGVAHAQPIATAIRVLGPASAPGRVTVINRPERLDLLSAAFVNAISANLLEFDDTHLRTVIHPTATVASAVFAIAEQRCLSGAALLHAFILGVEAECRIGIAVSPGHYARGWHITSTCGVFGAAAATAKLLNLDAKQTWHALGIAATQSAGLIENLSSHAKYVSVGNAARNGIFAALLAEQGYTAAPAAIEGPLGWARAMGDDPTINEALHSLGEEWELLNNTYKPYPCGVVLHAVIDACLALRHKHGLIAREIVEIVVSGDQLLLDRGDRMVTNERDARISIQHCAAISFEFGAAGLREFSEGVVHDPAIVALRSRTIVRLDPKIPRGAATVIVRTIDGRKLESNVLHAKGSLEHPLDDRDIEAKVSTLAKYGAFAGQIDAVIAATWQIEAMTTIAPLIALLQSG